MASTIKKDSEVNVMFRVSQDMTWSGSVSELMDHTGLTLSQVRVAFDDDNDDNQWAPLEAVLYKLTGSSSVDSEEFSIEEVDKDD